jgi:hypothetical protein
VYQTYAMPILMMPCSSFSYSNTRGVTAHLSLNKMGNHKKDGEDHK